jgi:hypothetical protein
MAGSLKIGSSLNGAIVAGALPVSGACWQPQFKGHTMMVSSNYNGWRLEDAWLDK